MKQFYIKEIVIFLIIALFAYTGANKLLDQSIFIFQMRLSPAPYMKILAPYLAWLIPVSELIVVFLLLFEKSRLIGLYSALALLVTFEIYILAMLLSGKDLPCACGGVVSLLSWKQHILFNGFFIAIDLLAISIQKNTRTDPGIANADDSKALTRA